MITPYDKGGACWSRGRQFEEVCKEAFKARGYAIRPSTKEEDMKLHADFFAYSPTWGRWLTIDAKAMKRISRNGALQEDFAYIEWKNTSGYPGWTVRGADVVVFERRSDMIVIAREVLLGFAKERVDRDKKVDLPFDSLYCSYSRESRQDEISLIRLNDLPKDNIQIWSKP